MYMIRFTRDPMHFQIGGDWIAFRFRYDISCVQALPDGVCT